MRVLGLLDVNHELQQRGKVIVFAALIFGAVLARATCMRTYEGLVGLRAGPTQGYADKVSSGDYGFGAHCVALEAFGFKAPGLFASRFKDQRC